MTRMQSSSRAPVLSATRRRDSCWITGRPPNRSCPPAAKAKHRKDAGSARSRRLRVRPRTPRGAGLQRAGGREMGGGRPSSLRRFHHLGEPPVLRLRERARLDDADDVAHLRLVALVVSVELRRAADDFLVARVRLDRVDLDHDRLVHRARDDDAPALLPAAALALRLRQPGDWLARLRALAPRPRAWTPLHARQALALRP